MMKSVKLAAAAALVVVALPLSAEAFPVAPAAGAAPEVQLVAGGCGPGFHRGPLLGCRPNRPLIRPLVRRPFCRAVLLPFPHRVCR